MRVPTLGFETNVEVAGRGPPVLLIHGWCDSHRTWRDVVPGLAERCRVYAPDLKGHGWSDKPDDPYHPDEFVAQIEALIEALDLRDLVLGGNSLGGMISAKLAPRIAGRLRGLLLLNAAGFPAPIRGPLKLLTIPGLSRIAALAMTRAMIAPTMASTVRDRRLVTRERVDEAAEILRMPGYKRAIRRFGGWTGVQHADPEALGALDVPTTIVWGTHDRIVPVEVGHRYRAAMPRARWVEIEDIAHLPQIERPEVVVRETLALVDG